MADQAYADIQSMATTIATGDAYLAAFRYENAVQAYQVAGAQFPTIAAELKQPPSDSATASSLAGLRWQLASQPTAHQAQTLAQQLLADLQVAYNAGGPIIPTSASVTPGVAPPASTTPTAAADSTAIVVGVVLAAVVAAGGLWLLRRKGKL